MVPSFKTTDTTPRNFVVCAFKLILLQNTDLRCLGKFEPRSECSALCIYSKVAFYFRHKVRNGGIFEATKDNKLTVSLFASIK